MKALLLTILVVGSLLAGYWIGACDYDVQRKYEDGSFTACYRGMPCED